MRNWTWSSVSFWHLTILLRSAPIRWVTRYLLKHSHHDTASSQIMTLKTKEECGLGLHDNFTVIHIMLWKDTWIFTRWHGLFIAGNTEILFLLWGLWVQNPWLNNLGKTWKIWVYILGFAFSNNQLQPLSVTIKWKQFLIQLSFHRPHSHGFEQFIW